MTNEREKTLQKIAEVLRSAASVLIFPHIRMDGDSLGSAVALARALRAAGKQAWILVAEDIPNNLHFMEGGLSTRDSKVIEQPDVCIAVDCSDAERIEDRKEAFARGKTTVVIDHHVTFDAFAEINLSDGQAAATGELVFELLKHMAAPIDRPIAEALYAAIVTDTGNFQYSNTSAKTHRITAELYASGIDHTAVVVEIYQNVRPQKILLLGAALNDIQMVADGKIALVQVTKEMFRQTGALISESEGIVEMLRSMRGVEVAAVLKEDNDKVRVGLRSKAAVDVAEIAALFGGGGHQGAAGFSSSDDIETTAVRLIEALKKSLLG
ncbi:MAG TPA: bifunctional oligoribonuclease/PAP phosphatase NrnA [Clostridiales bacterium]|jgi:phosphoesterase RecJ-like protein|nr:bifunctional oligoribonuclease/PAP phosphatase NrnA [Clostridiales bacterium]